MQRDGWFSNTHSVDGAFEVAEQPHRLLVDKRQKLHRQYGAQGALRVDPIERIVETCPRKPPGGAPSLVSRSIDRETQPPFLSTSLDTPGREVFILPAVKSPIRFISMLRTVRASMFRAPPMPRPWMPGRLVSRSKARGMQTSEYNG